uniref:Uncharacterized protein LOC100180858 n=1 Tax=Phallusia mammillata TaxID=59560 RepID=A0A6F9DI29_9ASCI|nr:uncharacterized protein LOC100180858 [Phallusia mammillata]
MPVSENALKQWLHDIQLAWRDDQCVSYITKFQRKQDLLHFIQELKITIQAFASLENAVKSLPSVAQFLGHVAWVPAFFVQKDLATAILECLLMLTVKQPITSIEKRSTNWAWQQISRLLKLPKTVQQAQCEAKDQSIGLILCQEIGFSYQSYLMESKKILFKLSSDYSQPSDLDVSNTYSCTSIITNKLGRATIPLLQTSFVNDVVKLLTCLGENIFIHQQFDEELAFALRNCKQKTSITNQIAIYESFPEMLQEDILEWLSVNGSKLPNVTGTESTKELEKFSWFKCCLLSPNLLLVLMKCIHILVSHPNVQNSAVLKMVDLILFGLEENGIKDLNYIPLPNATAIQPDEVS